MKKCFFGLRAMFVGVGSIFSLMGGEVSTRVLGDKMTNNNLHVVKGSVPLIGSSLMIQNFFNKN